MTRDERLLELADLAGAQWGLFTSAQAGELGFTAQQLKRLADAELITRIRQGVYRLTGAPESPADPIRAEWLALEPKRMAGDRLTDEVPVGVVSHRSAARLQELGDIDADVHEFTVQRRRSTRSHDVRFRICELARTDWHLVEGLPVTRPLRTVVDLADDGTDGGHLATIVRDAILTGDVTRDELAKALRPFAHRYGMQIGDGAALVRDFIGQAGIPEATRSLTRDLGHYDSAAEAAARRAATMHQMNQRAFGGLTDEARAKLFQDLVTASYPGIDAVLARHNERIAELLIPQIKLPLPAVENMLASIKFPTGSALDALTGSVREGLSSKVFENISDRALSRMAESMQDPVPRSAPAEKTGKGDSEGDEGSDAEVPDGQRTPKSDQ
ncbi:type IV toxin-antitoxin system AbiEi family antitoxin domain-containing protein [Nocardia brevicatena]|uniref:type IV toxin-antitoxin system AbiEi family antitoxin domain-containing protein n=1 Tax=Nocardia brevicatena TaxID=37327 RepID=UPI0002D748DE|nr:type IV toxin-antitoxin system AbiEi family antitoxin domain-containing protein [Nocardia brevicatena]